MTFEDFLKVPPLLEQMRRILKVEAKLTVLLYCFLPYGKILALGCTSARIKNTVDPATGNQQSCQNPQPNQLQKLLLGQ